MTHQALRPEFYELVDQYAPVGQVGTGFEFTEGPIWHPLDQFLLFSDMPGDVRRRWDRHGVREVMRPANKCNGMTYDANLNLIVCEHSTSSLIRERPDGTREVLASHFEGKELNSPNDVCVRSDGAIYFTDPWYGRMAGFGVERPRELGFQGLYRVRPGNTSHEPELMAGRGLFEMPNGLCFSPDETLLYVNDTARALIRVFDVNSDGTLKNDRIFASGIRSELKAGLPDGMKCDEQGNIWVTAPGGVWVYNPGGDLIGKLVIPEMVANLGWGGPNWRTLYLCATHSVYSVTTKVYPRSEPYMRATQPKQAQITSSVHMSQQYQAEYHPYPTYQSGQDANTSLPPLPKAPELTPKSTPEPGPQPTPSNILQLDPRRCALLIQDMQNDVVMPGGAFADSGSPLHCQQQNAIENIRRLAEVCRQRGVMVVHIWFVVEQGVPGVTMNAPLFEGLRDANALVRGTWGVAPVPGLEPQAGDLVVEKRRMSGWEGSALETVLKSGQRDTLINTGAWTNMSIEHTARTGADKGYRIIEPEDCCATMNADWHRASIEYALQNVATVTKADAVIAALQSG